MKSMVKPLILGTRGSALALAQSKLVREALEAAHAGLGITQKMITTTGDARTGMSLHEPAAEGAGLFTRQLEEALLSGAIDLAVHSLKDLPVEVPEGLVLAAILPRAPVQDLLISRYEGGVAGLPVGATIGTSSPRRALLIKAKRPDLTIVPIRGNVPTRLAKIAGSSQETRYDATILASAGLGRLGHDASAGFLRVDGEKLFLESLDWMLPAPGLLAPLHHDATARCVRAERLVLRYLGGGCHLALGTLAVESASQISLSAVFFPDEQSAPRYGEATAPTDSEVARLVTAFLTS